MVPVESVHFITEREWRNILTGKAVKLKTAPRVKIYCLIDEVEQYFAMSDILSTLRAY